MSSKRLNRRLAVWTKDGGVCWICLLPVTLEEVTLDHQIPRSKGGKGDLGNLRASHFVCNNERGNGEPHPPKKIRLPKAVGDAVRKAPKLKKPSRKFLQDRPVMSHITNENAREYLQKMKMTTDERIALQKQDEARREPKP